MQQEREQTPCDLHANPRCWWSGAGQGRGWWGNGSWVIVQIRGWRCRAGDALSVVNWKRANNLQRRLIVRPNWELQLLLLLSSSSCGVLPDPTVWRSGGVLSKTGTVHVATHLQLCLRRHARQPVGQEPNQPPRQPASLPVCQVCPAFD